MERKASFTLSVVLESRNLKKNFGGVIALDGVYFQVAKGKIMGLIGPNGAGKTTTIRLVLGLLRPWTGQVSLFGESPWNNPRVMGRVGVIQEKPKFPQGMATLDYLTRISKMHGRSSSHAEEVLNQIGLGDVPRRAIGKLSAGMLQKFALAHALINEPELIIADEPTSNLDPQARTEVLDRIISVNRENKTTFLISSHLLPELSRVCDSAAIINRGKIVASGSLNDLYQTFRSEVTRVSTDKPDLLAAKIGSLDYVKRVEVVGENITVESVEGKGRQLYHDVPKLADEIGVQLTGIESKSASLEELFRRATGSQ